MSQNHDTTNTNQEKQPLPGRVAIYTRGVTAAAQTPTPHVQTSDLLALVLEHGYCTEQVMLFEEGHVSGKTASLRRVALSELIHQMTQPQPGQEPIKAVFIANESRLFRDNDTIQVNAFIHLCRTYGVLLITPTRVYDFSTPTDVAQFRFLCEGAEQYIISRLQAVRRAAARRRQGKPPPHTSLDVWTYAETHDNETTAQ